MTLKAVIGFVAFVVVDLSTGSMILSSICLLAANAVFIVAYDIPHTGRLEKVGRLTMENVRPALMLLQNSAYIFVFTFLTTLLVNIPRYFVDAYHSEDDLGLFGIIIMPATMLNLFVQYIIQPKLVSLSERFQGKEYNSFNRTVTKLILTALGFGAIAIAAMWLIGCPVLSFILGEDLFPYRISLTLVVLAGTINTMTMIYSNILNVIRRFKIQLFNYLVATASVFVFAASFVASGSFEGAVLAFLIANAIQAALFVISYQSIFRKFQRTGAPI